MSSSPNLRPSIDCLHYDENNLLSERMMTFVKKKPAVANLM